MKIQKNDVVKQLLGQLGYSEHDKSYQHHYAAALYVLDNFWEDKHDFTEVEEESANEFISAFPKGRDLYDKLIEISKKKITISRIVDSSAEHTRAADLTFQAALKQFDDYLERIGVICFADKQDFIKKEDLWRLGYSEQQLNGLKEVFKYCPLIKDDGDRYTWVYPTITASLFALASVRDSRRDPVKDNNALVRNDENGKAFYPQPVISTQKTKPWETLNSESSVAESSSVAQNRARISPKELTTFQKKLLSLFSQLNNRLTAALSPGMSLGAEADNHHFEFGMNSVWKTVEEIKNLRKTNIKEYVEFTQSEEAKQFEVYFNLQTRSRIYGDKGASEAIRNRLSLDEKEMIAYYMALIFNEPIGEETKKIIGNQSVAEYQHSLQKVFGADILIRQAPNNPQYQPDFINDAVFLQVPQTLALSEALYSDETLKPFVQFEKISEKEATGIYIPGDKISLLHRSITSFLRASTVTPLQQRIAELTANSLSSFIVNSEKNQAYEMLLEALKNSSLEITSEEIFRQWEENLNQVDQFNKRTAMVSHRSMFYAKNSCSLTSSEKMIRELRQIIVPGSENNKREEIIHILIHRINKLNQNQANSEKMLLEKLLKDMQTMPLNSKTQDYCNKIIDWENSDCQIESGKTNKVFLQERKKSCGLFASSSNDILEKIKEELMPKQAQASTSFEA